MELVTSSLPARQRGLSLLYAMLAMVALALSSVALLRSANTSLTVSGNLAFQQDAAAASDQAVRQVVALLTSKLTASSSGLDADLAASGYYASSSDLIDVTGSQLSSSSRQLVRWFTSSDAPEGYNYCDKFSGYASCSFTPATLANVNGNTVRYIVFRLCGAAGDASESATTPIYCSKSLSSSSSSNTNESRDYSTGAGTASNVVSPYYRIVVRVTGARNTVSYSETLVHF